MLRRFLLGLLTVSAIGCGALDEFEEVIVDEALLPRQTTVGPFSPQFGGSLTNIDLSASREFRNNDVSPGDVDAIFVRSIVVETDAGQPDLSNMSLYISRIEFYVEADGVERRTLGTLTDIPMATSARIPVDSDLNLKPYATAPSMRVGTNVDIHTQPFVNVTFRTTLTLLVDINLLGS